MIDVNMGERELISLLVIAVGIVMVTLAARRKSSEADNTANQDTENTKSAGTKSNKIK